MKLNELHYIFLQRKVFMYANDGNTVVTRNKSVQLVSGNIYRGKDIVRQNGAFVDCCLYAFFFPEAQIGLKLFEVNTEKTVEEIMDEVTRLGCANAGDFVKMLRGRIDRIQPIGKAQISFLEQFRPDMIEDCWQARKRFSEKRAAEEAEKKAREDAENKAFVDAANAVTEKIVSEAVQTIRVGGVLRNAEITVYRSRYDYSTYQIINHLARLYGVSIPLRTQGWINKSLLSIEIKDGKMTGGRMDPRARQSGVIFEYMNKLIDAVNAAAERSA